MSFSFYAQARSRVHALQLLEKRKSELPAPVHAFIKTSLDNMTVPRDAQRVIIIEASGHLCDSASSSVHSSATIKVQPIDIPD